MVVFGKMEINDQVSDIKNEVFQLMSQKSRIENEIQQLFQILSAVSYKLWDRRYWFIYYFKLKS